MTYRKTWFSYVLWLLYTLLCIVLLIYAGSIWTGYLAGMPYMRGFPDSLFTPLAGLSDGLLILIGLSIIPGTIALYWIIRGIAGQIRKKCLWKETVIIGLECVIVLLVMAGGIFLRAVFADFYISIAEKGQFTESGFPAEYEPLVDTQTQGMMYYNMAVVTQERSGTSIICYSIRELYVICLSVVLSFLGNKIASAIIMQIFLQIIGMMLIYTVTRKLAGRIPACVALLYIACSICCLNMLALFSPEWLFFDLYMIGMLIVVCFVKGYCANRLSRQAALVGSAVIGVMIGALAYLDITAATLLIIMSAVFIGKKHCTEEKPVHNSGIVSVLVMIVTLITSTLCRGIMIGVIYGSRGVDFLRNIVDQWIDLQKLFGEPFSQEYPYICDIYMIGILVIPAAFLVFEFFRSGMEQNYDLWILMCILTASTPMAVIGTGRFGLLSLYIWSVLAGLGLQNCIFGGRAKMVQAVIEEINAAVKTDESKEPEKADEKPRYFDNPLPLPKKHVKREMDYQYPVEEKDMKYDVEVSENDDFEIQ